MFNQFIIARPEVTKHLMSIYKHSHVSLRDKSNVMIKLYIFIKR
jgi:hypothetical protein